MVYSDLCPNHDEEACTQSSAARNLSGDGDEKNMLAALDMQTPLHPSRQK